LIGASIQKKCTEDAKKTYQEWLTVARRVCQAGSSLMLANKNAEEEEKKIPSSPFSSGLVFIPKKELKWFLGAEPVSFTRPSRFLR